MAFPWCNLNQSVVRARQYASRFFCRDIVPLRSGNPDAERVLLSYLTHPFRADPDDPAFYSHTNTWECLQMARTWLQHGYDVDVIDWDNRIFRPDKDYSVFIDIHANMERLSPFLPERCRKILHITGAHWRFQNEAEMKRITDLEKRRGIRLLPRRQVPPSRGIEVADCATILGNAFTRGTFSFAGKPLYSLPLSTTVEFPFPARVYGTVRNRFLWLGMAGMVHKGLDLVLEAFTGLPDCHLTVCGPVSREPDFERAYEKELYRTENIHTTGFVDLRSERFHSIIRNTCALVYPSCSEGQAGSVITTMHAGLIPVISAESGVDVEDFGIMLPECTVGAIKNAVTTIARTPENELERMAKGAWQYARDEHTRKKFTERYGRFVQKINRKTQQR